MNLFDAVPSNFFNLLSSQSNGRIYSDCLQVIYREYEHEISYRISRERIRDALAVYLRDADVHIENDPEMQNDNAGDMASAILRKFCTPEVGWLCDEIDDVTYGHNIVMTEQGILLAEFLQQLMKPEKAEFSSYIFDIYNRLHNEKQWGDNPYVNALEAVYRNARDLSRALKRLSTFIRDIIERMVKEQTLESLTNNILEYCNGDFIKEYARLNKQQNIHVYRTFIVTKLKDMENSRRTYNAILDSCMKETGLDQEKAENLIIDKFSLTKKFLQDDYDNIMKDIQHKITVYMQIAVGRARFLQNRDPNTRGYIEQVMHYLIESEEDPEMKESIKMDLSDLFEVNEYFFIDTSSLRYPGRTNVIRTSEEVELVSITEEEKEEGLRLQKEAAYDPYSKAAMKAYILDQMHGAADITSDQLPMGKPEEVLAALSAAAYGNENGFEVEVLEGYREENHLRLHRFRLQKKEI